MPRRLDRAEALEFLAAGARTGKLGLGGGRGPIVVPIWFVLDGEDLVFSTFTASAKARRLRVDPRAALCVDDESFPFTFVQVRGRVDIATPAPEELLPWATRIAARYVPAGRADEFGARNAVIDELLCRLHIEQVIGEADIAG